MPANTSPIFILTPNRGILGGARVSSANSTRDLSNTSNAVNLFTAGSNGSRIDAIDWVHSSNAQTTGALTAALSVATVARLFQCTDTSFSNPRLLREVALSAVQASSTVIGQTATMSFTTPLVLPSGYTLVVTLSVAQNTGGAYDVTVYGGDF